MGFGVSIEDRIEAPAGAFLIEHPAAGPVLIDTGFSARVARHRFRDLGPLNGVFFKGLAMDESEAVTEQLQRRGVDPSDVRLVVMTHLHTDHASGMGDFTSATFVTTRREWQAARRPAGVFDGYLRRHLPPQRSIKFVDFATAQVIEGHLRAIDLLEDGSILLVPTPGHTVDHFSVLVSTNRGPVFLLGDAAFTLRNLDEQVLPWRNHDDEAYSKSLRQLRAYQETHPDTLLVPTHDARAWKQLEARS